MYARTILHSHDTERHALRGTRAQARSRTDMSPRATQQCLGQLTVPQRAGPPMLPQAREQASLRHHAEPSRSIVRDTNSSINGKLVCGRHLVHQDKSRLHREERPLTSQASQRTPKPPTSITRSWNSAVSLPITPRAQRTASQSLGNDPLASSHKWLRSQSVMDRRVLPT